MGWRSPHAVIFCSLFLLPLRVSATTFAVVGTVTVTSAIAQNQQLRHWPDLGMGFLPSPISGQYFGFSSGLQSGTAAGTGSYVAYGNPAQTTPGSFYLNYLSAGVPQYGLTDGTRQPSPDGSTFDLNYGGGGPTYALGPTVDRSFLVQIYHGEFSQNPPASLPAYGGSGMATSVDGGRTWRKVGQILQPFITQAAWFAGGNGGGLWADATMIQADASGNFVGNNYLVNNNKSSAYNYLIYTDLPSLGANNCLGLARIPTSSLIAALASGMPPAFSKYYNGAFSQTGLGGNFTPVIANTTNYVASPSIVYDSFAGAYLLVYSAAQQQVLLQTSTNLISWSAPQVLVDLTGFGGAEKLFYSSLLDVVPTGQPHGFYVYYQQADVVGGQNLNGRLMQIAVSES